MSIKCRISPTHWWCHISWWD